MPQMEPHVFQPGIDGKLCKYLNSDLILCGELLEDHPEVTAPPARLRTDRLSRVGGPNGPKVCAECENGLFKLDLRDGLIVLTCSGCDEETEVPWGVLRGHLKEPE